MKIFTFSLLLISGFYFSQQLPHDKIQNYNVDSLRILKLGDLLPHYAESQKPDTLLYKILNKKPDNVEKYAMLTDKNIRGALSIPNIQQKTFSIPDPFKTERFQKKE